MGLGDYNRMIFVVMLMLDRQISNEPGNFYREMRVLVPVRQQQVSQQSLVFILG